MNTQFEKLTEIIREQQKGHEYDDVFCVGEQLLDMSAHNAAYVDILIQDLAVEKMGLADAAQEIRQYADKNHGKAKCFCVTPKIAEGILKEFYGLPESETAVPDKAIESEPDYIDLGEFL